MYKSLTSVHKARAKRGQGVRAEAMAGSKKMEK